MNALRLSLPLVVIAPLLACPAAPGEGEGEPAVAYNPTVGNILNHNCVSCHQPGGIGPFSLATYEDAKGIATILPAVVEARIMPPWAMDESGDCNTFHDSRALSDEDIATISAWVEDGSPEGDPANAPDAPPSSSSLARVDATLDPGVEYVPDQLADDYRCFPLVADESLTDRFLTGFEVKPGADEIVHHVILYRVPSTLGATVDSLDASSPGPGYTCFGSANTGSEEDVLAGWAPGTGATLYPEGTGLRFNSGDRLIMQIHYNPQFASGQADRTTMDLQLADTVDEEAFIRIWANFFELDPGEAEESTSYSQAIGGTRNVKVYGIFPHMHQLGRTMEVYANGGGTQLCMAKVPRYDFNWQRFYFYDEPVTLTPGANVNVSCTYDTRGRTAPIRFGEATDDEMCVVIWYYTRP